MKKFTSILVFALLVLTLFSPALTVSADPVAQSVSLEPGNGDVVVRTGADMTKLTDGDKVWDAEGKNNFSMEGIVLIQNKKAYTSNDFPTCNLIIDLGSQKKVNTVNITFYHYFDAIIDTPKDGEVTISYSIDGDGFAEIGTFEIEGKASSGTSGIFDENISLGETVDAKEIMVSMAFGSYPVTSVANEWFGFTELSAGMAIDYIGEDNSEEISEAVSELSEIEDTSSIVESDVISDPAESEDEVSVVSEADKTDESDIKDVDDDFPWVTIGIIIGLVVIGAVVTMIVIKKRKV
ncbi:MAG TPA: hypothetical protein DCP51_03305 [Clostridiales bacterium]|nr:MAG: hypothetical protein A2Y40_06405 [Candidatus Margulisbacteria bacterium GWF2_35_9]HAN20692.1 hypothetical protein [Clostridiales bacterium]